MDQRFRRRPPPELPRREDVERDFVREEHRDEQKPGDGPSEDRRGASRFFGPHAPELRVVRRTRRRVSVSAAMNDSAKNAENPRNDATMIAICCARNVERGSAVSYVIHDSGHSLMAASA